MNETTQIQGAQAATGLLQLVSFHLAGEEYGIDILAVQEINRMLSITRVPNSPDSIEGVINLRGRVIPVLNLRKKFGLEARETDGQTRIIVVNVDGLVIGMVVDAVSEVLRLDPGAVQPPPSAVTGQRADYIKGIGNTGDRMLILLDLSRVAGDAGGENGRSAA